MSRYGGGPTTKWHFIIPLTWLTGMFYMMYGYWSLIAIGTYVLAFGLSIMLIPSKETKIKKHPHDNITIIW